MQYEATTKYIRVSTRKVRLVADAVRRMTPVAALAALSQMTKSAAVPLSKTIASAIANATVKGAVEDTLRFKTIEVMGGPAMKRWQAVSRGQAHAFKKRMTHIRIIVVDKAAEKGETHGTKN
jgi:large subunit ribosomal protein L22